MKKDGIVVFFCVPTKKAIPILFQKTVIAVKAEKLVIKWNHCPSEEVVYANFTVDSSELIEII